MQRLAADAPEMHGLAVELTFDFNNDYDRRESNADKCDGHFRD